MKKTSTFDDFDELLMMFQQLIAISRAIPFRVERMGLGLSKMYKRRVIPGHSSSEYVSTESNEYNQVVLGPMMPGRSGTLIAALFT